MIHHSQAASPPRHLSTSPIDRLHVHGSLEPFRQHVMTILDGRPGRCPSDDERMWLMAFRVAYEQYRDGRLHISKDESFSLSFAALVRCVEKGTAGDYHYLLRACRNAHIDHLRDACDEHRRLPRNIEVNPWHDVDLRLDFETALSRISTSHPKLGTVAKMVREGYTDDDIAEELGLKTGRHVRTLKTKADRLLQEILKDYDHDC
jgi:hypothetical protein